MQVPTLSVLSNDAFKRSSPSQKKTSIYRSLRTRNETIRRLCANRNQIGVSESEEIALRVRMLQAEVFKLLFVYGPYLELENDQIIEASHRLLLAWRDASTLDTGIPKLSSLCWNAFDQMPPARKRECLDPYLQTRETIYRFSDIRKGDHLVRKGSTMTGSLLFEHHFLCVNHINGQPVIIHYFVSMKQAFWRMFDFSLLGSGESFATVKHMVLPHADFIKCEEDLQKQGEEVERVVWPDALRRYSAETVFHRAILRLGEHRYHVTENNCENFVMWCICGSNVSLQATPKRKTAWETVSALALLFTPFRTFTISYIITAFRMHYGHTTDIMNWRVFIYVTTLVESTKANNEMKRCRLELMESVISKRDYIEKLSDIVVITLFRTGLHNIGVFVGEMFFSESIFNALVPLAGLVGGHFAGYLTVRCNLIWLRSLTTRMVTMHFSLYPRDIRRNATLFWTFVWTPITSSRMGFKVLSRGIKYGLTTEILRCLLSPIEVFGMSFCIPFY